MRRFVLLITLAAMGLAGCAPAQPTVDPAQIQASAVAAASTMIAMTIAAVPTSTPVPPTPVPSPTPLPLPTLPPVPTAAAAPTKAASSGDCNQLLDVGSSGPTAPVVIKNTTKGPTTVTMGISTKNTFGQCGYLAWAIGRGDSVSVSVPQIRTNLGDSCYWVYAWVNDPKHQAHPSASGFCIDNALKWTINVSYDKITITPP